MIFLIKHHVFNHLQHWIKITPEIKQKLYKKRLLMYGNIHY